MRLLRPWPPRRSLHLHLPVADGPPALTWLPVVPAAPTALKAEKEAAEAQEAEAAKEKEEDDLEKLLSL